MMATQGMPYAINDLVGAKKLENFSPYLIRAALKKANKTEYTLDEAVDIVTNFANERKG